MNAPRVLIAGLRGGSGKTVVSAGLAAAWHKANLCVSPFKKGPDYIDAAWLTEASGRPCRNLDLFLMDRESVLRSFGAAADRKGPSVIEGNRGLYDGMDAQGTYSTAELAKLLGAPVLLVVDCTKSTRTMAATVLGCQALDPDVSLEGIILNRIAGPRHERVLRKAMAETSGLPVLGALPRLGERAIPERHLGLLPPQEHGGFKGVIDKVAALAKEGLDLGAIEELARSAPALEAAPPAPPEPDKAAKVRIGVFRDAAFQFYYPENLEALQSEGGELVEISPLADPELPDVDALYIGGGFPETLAKALAANESFRTSLHRAVENGLPAYAECGGAVYLGERLVVDGVAYPMTGLFPVTFGFGPKPQGHGYAVLEATAGNPFYPEGETIRGHEFHYTFVQTPLPEDTKFTFSVRRGHGFDGRHDGLCRGNVLALYTHIHALGVPGWAPAVVREAARYKTR
jgi:cobyrinic acid a,c-diamide synthase